MKQALLQQQYPFGDMRKCFCNCYNFYLRYAPAYLYTLLVFLFSRLLLFSYTLLSCHNPLYFLPTAETRRHVSTHFSFSRLLVFPSSPLPVFPVNKFQTPVKQLND